MNINRDAAFDDELVSWIFSRSVWLHNAGERVEWNNVIFK